MIRKLLIMSMLTGISAFAAWDTADAAGWGRGGHGRGGFGRGFATGLGVGAFWDDDDGLAELYRELLRNVPYYALHPPVYYSYPVPRPYGWSPFADPIGTIPPDISCQAQPLEIINPYVPSGKTSEPEKKADTTASNISQPEPLVIYNPYFAGKSLAQTEH